MFLFLRQSVIIIELASNSTWGVTCLEAATSPIPYLAAFVQDYPLPLFFSNIFLVDILVLLLFLLQILIKWKFPLSWARFLISGIKCYAEF